ncbi:hypothetical protein RB653_006289 [Dictyostelium firmibasis]|uniref:CobW C-terminal domain-containing protein n=1 Tax=Dictyostelium firmibasis TaxID=79012 RepID=A0AAN7UMF4_9MYCE
MTDAIVVIGFISSGKASLYHSIRKENLGLKVAYLFDGVGTLPQSVLDETKGYKTLVEDTCIELQNGSIVTVMEEEFIGDFILKKGKFDKVIFFSHPFESTFLLEVLSCGDEMEGSLGEFISNVKLINVVCILDAESLLKDLKSDKKVGDMMKIMAADEDIEDVDYEDIDDENYEKQLSEKFEKQQLEKHDHSSCCNENGVCSSSTKQNNTKLECGKGCQKECCDNENDENDDLKDLDADVDELVKSTDKLVSTLILEQISISNIIILNKIDKIEKSKLEFIEKLLNLISSSLVIESSYCKIPNFQILFNYVVTVRDYKLESETDTETGISIVNYYQRKPFHPTRLNKLLYDTTEKNENNQLNSTNFKGVLLTTGLIWLANDMKNKYNFEILEGKEMIGNKRPFWSTMKESEWNPTIKENIEREIKLFKYQDRKIELSIVGLESNGFDKDIMIKKLDQCLLTDKEMELGPNIWETDFKSDFF